MKKLTETQRENLVEDVRNGFTYKQASEKYGIATSSVAYLLKSRNALQKNKATKKRAYTRHSFTEVPLVETTATGVDKAMIVVATKEIVGSILREFMR